MAQRPTLPGSITLLPNLMLLGLHKAIQCCLEPPLVALQHLVEVSVPVFLGMDAEFSDSALFPARQRRLLPSLVALPAVVPPPRLPLSRCRLTGVSVVVRVGPDRLNASPLTPAR